MHVAVGDCLVVHRLEKIKLLLVTIFLFSLRPKPKDSRNNLSCCCSWIFHLIYELSTPTTVLPLFFIIISLFYHYLSLYLPCYLSITVYLSLHLCITISMYLPIHLSITICQSINRNSIAADPQAGISLVIFGQAQSIGLSFYFLPTHSFILYNDNTEA